MPAPGPTSLVFFGGSFDPPHCGHIHIALAAQQVLDPQHPGCVEVRFAPVGRQPLKPDGASASFADRVAMTRLAIAAYPGFTVSLADAPHPDRHAPNYTADTLLRLRAEQPHARLYLLLGADSFRTLHHWHRAADIPFLATLVIAARPGEDLANLPALLPTHLTLQTGSVTPTLAHHTVRNSSGAEAHILILPNLRYDISATELRRAIHHTAAEGRFLPAAVLAYIRTHGLYPAPASA